MCVCLYVCVFVRVPRAWKGKEAACVSVLYDFLYVSPAPARAMVVRLAWHVADRLGGVIHLVAGPCVFSPCSLYVCALAAVYVCVWCGSV